MKIKEAIKQCEFPLYYYGDSESKRYLTINTWAEVFKFFGVTPNDVVVDTHPFYKNDKNRKCIVMASVWDMNDYMNDKKSRFAGFDMHKWDWLTLETDLDNEENWSAVVYLKEKKI